MCTSAAIADSWLRRASFWYGVSRHQHQSNEERLPRSQTPSRKNLLPFERGAVPEGLEAVLIPGAVTESAECGKPTKCIRSPSLNSLRNEWCTIFKRQPKIYVGQDNFQLISLTNVVDDDWLKHSYRPNRGDYHDQIASGCVTREVGRGRQSTLSASAPGIGAQQQ